MNRSNLENYKALKKETFLDKIMRMSMFHPACNLFPAEMSTFKEKRWQQRLQISLSRIRGCLCVKTHSRTFIFPKGCSISKRNITFLYSPIQTNMWKYDKEKENKMKKHLALHFLPDQHQNYHSVTSSLYKIYKGDCFRAGLCFLRFVFVILQI